MGSQRPSSRGRSRRRRKGKRKRRSPPPAGQSGEVAARRWPPRPGTCVAPWRAAAPELGLQRRRGSSAAPRGKACSPPRTSAKGRPSSWRGRWCHPSSSGMPCTTTEPAITACGLWRQQRKMPSDCWGRAHWCCLTRSSAASGKICTSSVLDARNMHYPPETSSIMLMARMVATIKQAKDKEWWIKAFSQFCNKTANEEEEIVHKLLGDKFKGQLELLRLLFTEALYDEHLSRWFTPEGFRSLFALVGTNGQGIGTSSLSQWVHACDALDLPMLQREELDAFIDQLYKDIEKESGEFLNCEGSGLYVLQSCCNHSCIPNAETSFPENNFLLHLTALEDIKAGEEICISYLDCCQRERSRHSRNKILRENYLFTCSCPKCLAQADDADVTSDEEEEGEGETDDAELEDEMTDV
ncbi:histone-lysine N-trimethyltransferase SMYD5 isoform X2 [Falco biarmicus]|uniref:histone-lysine N-trimethyltransferase SMYD5 isoform X2 n=1 Tax=Falco biarmicus TaxID=345155 RepID=UPI0024BCD50D|nr:histone-lysine N-trimethyltransferase SMYD5 isoform X2 [Falco biarmicus]